MIRAGISRRAIGFPPSMITESRMQTTPAPIPIAVFAFMSFQSFGCKSDLPWSLAPRYRQLGAEHEAFFSKKEKSPLIVNSFGPAAGEMNDLSQRIGLCSGAFKSGRDDPSPPRPDQAEDLPRLFNHDHFRGIRQRDDRVRGRLDHLNQVAVQEHDLVWVG